MNKLTFLTIFMMGAAIFTGCKKDDANIKADPAYASATDYNYNTEITYKLSFARPTGDPMTGGNPVLNWDGGYMHVTGLVFNALYGSGNNLQSDKFGAQVYTTMQLFDPTILGTVKMPSINTNMASFTIQATAAGAQHAMVLNGVYNRAADMSPVAPDRVIVIVDEDITLNSQWLYNFSVGSTGHTACMQLDMAQLADGIDRNMMNQATISGNTIIISAQSNNNIYQAMMNNLRNMQVTVTCQTPPMGQSDGAAM